MAKGVRGGELGREEKSREERVRAMPLVVGLTDCLWCVIVNDCTAYSCTYYSSSSSSSSPFTLRYMPTLRLSSSFCFNLINPQTHLLLAPGSLMIDVFIRNNYTADSNGERRERRNERREEWRREGRREVEARVL